MTGNLISSGSDTDVRIGVVAALSLAIVISAAAFVSQRGEPDRRGTVVLSASTPEIVRTSPEMVRTGPKLLAQHPDGTGAAIE
jgi:hypothetical protein